MHVNVRRVALRPTPSGELVLVYEGKRISHEDICQGDCDNVSTMHMIRFFNEVFDPPPSDDSKPNVAAVFVPPLT